MKVYISGQITGLELEAASINFENAESILVDLGHTTVNPMKLCSYNPAWERA